MSGKVPPCRRFPKRLSQQELKEKTTNYMNENGADNHYKAEYYLEAAKLVVGMKDQKFFTLQPNIHHKDSKNDAWGLVFQLVIQFLKQNNMNLTIESMQKECGGSIAQEEESIEQIDEYMERLLDLSDSLASKSFKDRVSEWKVEDSQGLKG